jgi:hypothetical protein
VPARGCPESVRTSRRHYALETVLEILGWTSASEVSRNLVQLDNEAISGKMEYEGSAYVLTCQDFGSQAPRPRAFPN